MRHPAVPLTLALLAGTLVGCHTHLPAGVWAAVILVDLSLTGVCLRRREERLFVVMALLTTFVCGGALADAATARALSPDLRRVLTALGGARAVSDVPTDPVIVTGRLSEDVVPDGDRLRLTVDVERLETRGRQLPVTGAVRLSLGGALDSSRADEWREGRTIRTPALLRRPARYLNPAVPDFERVLLRQGIAMVGSVKSARLVETVRRGSWLDERAAAARSTARRVIDRYIGVRNSQSGAIARAIVIGDRSGLDDETQERMLAAGTYHVLAISGGNVAILTGVILALLRLSGLKTPAIEIIAVVAILVYAGLVSGGPSVNRATLMAAAMLCAHALGHRTPPFNALAVAGGIGVATNPLTVFDRGTWLTYGATLAIVIGVLMAGRRLQRRPAWVRVPAALLLASVAAELALFPVSAYAFSRVTAAGLVVNFVAVPAMTLVEVGAMATLGAAALSGRVAAWLGWQTHNAAWALVESGRFVDLAPWLCWRLPAPPGWALALYYGGWALILVAARLLARRPGVTGSPVAWLPAARWRLWLRRGRWTAGVAVVMAAFWILRAPVTWGTTPHTGVRVTFIDVGQGDAALVQLPGGESLLVDAGGAGGSQFDIGRRVLAPVLWARGVRRLSALVVTHGDADHINGAAAVVRDFRPREIWEGVPVPRHEPLAAVRRLALGQGIRWRSVQRGDRVACGPADVVVWNPPLPAWERQRVRNDDSVVLEIRLGGVSIVLPGDVEASAEQEIVPNLEGGSCRVLQAPHHGSSSSSTAPLVAGAGPVVGIFSVGRGNPFGHPHWPVLERFRAAGSRVFRTDRDGAITITTDGGDIAITTMSGRALTIPGVPAGSVR